MGRRRAFDKDDVLRVVEEHFWRSGYRATSIQDIATATGVNSGSLINCFGSKRDLYLSALQRYADEDSPRAVLLRSFDAPLVDALRDFFEEVIKRVGQGCPGCLVSNHVSELATTKDDVAEPSIDLMRSVRQTLELRLVWARDHGELAADADIPALSGHLFCVLQGLYVLSVSTRDVDDMRRASEAALSLVRLSLREAAKLN